MARLRVLVGAILTATLVLAFAVPASASGGGTAKVRAVHNSPDTAWAVGFLTPTDDYPGFGVFVSVDD